MDDRNGDGNQDDDIDQVPCVARQACIDGNRGVLLRLLDDGKVVDITTYKQWRRAWEFDETDWSRDGKVMRSLARVAASHGKIDCYSLLLLYPDPLLRTGDLHVGTTYLYAMHMMCLEAMQDIVLRYPAMYHTPIFQRLTYFHRAATLSASKAVLALEVILAAGGDPLRGDPSVLTTAILEGTPGAVDLLYRRCPQYDIRRLLPTAVRNRLHGREIVQYLLRHGAGVDELALAGPPRTALWLAVQNEDSAMVDLLLHHGADCRTLQPGGQSAVDLAYDMRLAGIYHRMTGNQMDAPDGGTRAQP